MICLHIFRVRVPRLRHVFSLVFFFSFFLSYLTFCRSFVRSFVGVSFHLSQRLYGLWFYLRTNKMKMPLIISHNQIVRSFIRTTESTNFRKELLYCVSELGRYWALFEISMERHKNTNKQNIRSHARNTFMHFKLLAYVSIFFPNFFFWMSIFSLSFSMNCTSDYNLRCYSTILTFYSI